MYIHIYIYIYIYVITKVQIEYWDKDSNVKVCSPYSHLSRHAQTFPPSYRYLQDFPHRLRGSRAQKQQLKTQNMLGCAAYE